MKWGSSAIVEPTKYSVTSGSPFIAGINITSYTDSGTSGFDSNRWNGLDVSNYGGTYTNSSKVYFYRQSGRNGVYSTKTSDSYSLGNAFENTSAYKAFSATADFEYGQSRNSTLSTGMLTIFGNQHSFTFNQSSNIYRFAMGSNTTLNIFGVGKYNYDTGTVEAAWQNNNDTVGAVFYTHLRAHETRHDLACRLPLDKKKMPQINPLLTLSHPTHPQLSTPITLHPIIKPTSTLPPL